MREPEITSLPTVMSTSESEKKNPRRKTKSRLLTVSVGVLSFALGVGLTGLGATEFAIGERFTKEELEKAKKESYDLGESAGYDAGEEAGYDDGLESGRTAGYAEGSRDGFSDGCNKVFDEIGENLIAIRAPWTRLSVYGLYWPRSSIC
jgi:flagellar biosynthesis/type III secretory pathway protein FliH